VGTTNAAARPGVRVRATHLRDRAISRSNDVNARLIRRFGHRRPWYESADFPWTAPLEARSDQLRAELDAVLEEKPAIPNFWELSSPQLDLTQDDRWKTFALLAYGKRVEANCARCPATIDALERFVPGVQSAMFSIIEPRKHIPAHRGPNHSVLRHHLPLIVPSTPERCRIRVGDEVRHWEYGTALIFDDTFEHEVWNDTDELRVVLFTDFLRPLPFPLSTANRINDALMARTSFAREIVDNTGRLAQPART